MAIVFGSAEAKAIREKDLELQRQAEGQAEREAQENSIGWIDAEIDRLQGELTYHEDEAAHYQHEIDEMYAKRKKLKEQAHGN